MNVGSWDSGLPRDLPVARNDDESICKSTKKHVISAKAEIQGYGD